MSFMSFFFRAQLFCLLSVSLLLSGCSTLHPVTYQDASWKTREAQLSQLKNFTAQGVISIHQGKQAEKASFYLEQKGQAYQLSLYGPLGMGRHTIKGDPKGVTLRNASGKVFTATSPEILLKKQTGWNLPLSNLQYWIRGLPSSHKHLRREAIFDRYHHLEQLKQQGWKISYERYIPVMGYELPSKIRFEQQDLQVVIVIKEWVVD
jgi:outer membrane lipoprotein LolB